MDNMPINRFMSAVETFDKFTLVCNDPFKPIAVKMDFDRISGCMSASSYIALQNACGHVCLTHITSITRSETDGDSVAYEIACKDHTISGVNCPAEFIIECRKGGE